MQVILNEDKELGQKQREQIKRGFRLADSRSKGKLKKDEAVLLFRAAGQSPTEEELDNMFKGEPDIGNFEAIFKAHYKPPIEDQGDIEDLLKVFDVSGNGLLSKQQFIDVMTGMGEKVDHADLERLFENMRQGTAQRPVSSRGWRPCLIWRVWKIESVPWGADARCRLIAHAPYRTVIRGVGVAWVLHWAPRVPLEVICPQCCWTPLDFPTLTAWTAL